MIIGITGGIATGKSTVADILERRGFFRVDADKIYNDLLNNSYSMIAELEKRFQSHDKSVIMHKIETEKSALKDLNTITHKYVVEKIDGFVKSNIGKNIVIEAPVPVKRGFLDIVEFIIVTNCSRKTQIERILERKGIIKEKADIMMEFQLTAVQYAELGDYIINTDGMSSADLKKVIDLIHPLF